MPPPEETVADESPATTVATDPPDYSTAALYDESALAVPRALPQLAEAPRDVWEPYSGSSEIPDLVPLEDPDDAHALTILDEPGAASQPQLIAGSASVVEAGLPAEIELLPEPALPAERTRRNERVGGRRPTKIIMAPPRKEDAHGAAAGPVVVVRTAAVKVVESDPGTHVEDAAAAALLDDAEVAEPGLRTDPASTEPAVKTGPDQTRDALAMRTASRSTGGGEFAGAGLAPVVAPEPATSRERKQGNLKIFCPACQCQGELPWGRMDSLLCCSRCWHWYRLGTHGRLTEVPAPKNSAKGILRFYKGAGPGRVVEVTPSEFKQKRRAWGRRRMWGLTALAMPDRDGLTIWCLVAYLVGLFVVGYFYYGSTPGVIRPVSIPGP